MSEGQEQNKSEEATPFKLRKAREKGQVARGMDLGFVGSLVALTAVALMAGESFFARLADLMRYSLGVGISIARAPNEAMAIVRDTYWLAFQPLLLLGAAIAIILITLELIQLRGFFFTTQPLKPDFQRLNPAKGLKRLFSVRMLKETLKNIIKFCAYAGAAWFLISGAVETYGPRTMDAARLTSAMELSAMRLMFVFIGLAVLFMVIDQLIVRQEFKKQMRMSKREVTRENKEREGEPRFKQKRRDIHAEMRQQSEGLGKIPGSDMLVVNPEHFAVALHYDPQTMAAPMVRAKGRNHFAQLMKRRARMLAIPTMANPRLARALFHESTAGKPIEQQHYYDVASLYRSMAKPLTGAGPDVPDLDGDSA